MSRVNSQREVFGSNFSLQGLNAICQAFHNERMVKVLTPLAKNAILSDLASRIATLFIASVLYPVWGIVLIADKLTSGRVQNKLSSQAEIVSPSPVNSQIEKAKHNRSVSTQLKNPFEKLPRELLPLILKFLRVDIRLQATSLCKLFSKVIRFNLSPIERLGHKNCPVQKLEQKTLIFRFLVHSSQYKENSSDLVITGDCGDYDDNPVVTLWENGQAINEMINSRGNTAFLLKNEIDNQMIESCRYTSFFYKSVEYMTIGGKSLNYLAAAQYNQDGLIQIWDLNKKVKLIEKKLEKEITHLHSNLEDLCIGFDDGMLRLCKFTNLNLIKEWQAHDSKITWAGNDSMLQRIFTSSYTSLKIWDAVTFDCVKVIPAVSKIHYDPTSKILIGKTPDERTLCLWKGEDGEEIAKFGDETESITAFHYNAPKELLFAAFSGCPSKIVVWDLKTQSVLNSIPLLYPRGLTDCIYQLDFDPESEMILTEGYLVSLWSLKESTLFQSFSKAPHSREVHWDKAAQKLYVLDYHRLYVKDYSKPLPELF